LTHRSRDRVQHERDRLLEEFVAAVVGDDPAHADRMRARVTEELGPDWLVDASAVIANFEMMTRLADATGARPRPEQLAEAAEVRAERGLDRFESRPHRSARVAPDPQAHPVGSSSGDASVACEAVLHMHRQLGTSRAHRTVGDVVCDPTSQPPVELAVDERVEVAAEAEMVDAHHGGGNPSCERLLPAE
jgi:DNA-binding phage protein